MKTKILSDLLFFTFLILAAGCRENVGKTEEQCVRNLEIIDAAARSYCLEKNLDFTQLIAPSDLAGFLKEGNNILDSFLSLGSHSFRK
jgi:hypothetical protein